VEVSEYKSRSVLLERQMDLLRDDYEKRLMAAVEANEDFALKQQTLIEKMNTALRESRDEAQAVMSINQSLTQLIDHEYRVIYCTYRTIYCS
jgi:predicted HAD superfamily Cof-like phosphohydrolase